MLQRRGCSLVRLGAIPLLAVLLGVSVPARPQTTALVPAADTSLQQSAANRNRGGEPVLRLQGGKERALVAFDTGPGNALIDDFLGLRLGRAFDEDGAVAAAGRVSEAALEGLGAHPYVARKPPKSLDRQDFHGFLDRVAGLSTEDGAATLAALTVACVAEAARHFPEPAGRWLVCGGGRRNRAVMAMLAQRTNGEVAPVERVRTRSRARERLLDYARQRHDDSADAWVVQHIQEPEAAAQMADQCREIFGCDPAFVSEIGPVVGAHGGPGLVGTGGMERSLIEPG